MMIVSYFIGQKHYPVKYNLRKIGLFFGLALGFYFIALAIKIESLAIRLIVRTFIFLFYLYIIIYFERPSLLKFKKTNL